MKIIIAACLLAVAAARCAKGPQCDMSMFEDLESRIEHSFQFKENGLYFQCTKSRWIQVTPPPAIMERIEKEEINPTDLCWDADAHIEAYKYVFQLLDGCERSQKKVFMAAAMREFHKYCIAGQHDQCFEDVGRKLGSCAARLDMCPDKMDVILNDEKCGDKLEQFEGCIESGEPPRCAEEIGKWYMDMKQRLEDASDEMTRHELMCEVMKNF